MSKMLIRHNRVAISPPHSLPLYVSSLFELRDYSYRCPLDNPYSDRYVAKPHLRVLGEANYHVAMIAQNVQAVAGASVRSPPAPALTFCTRARGDVSPMSITLTNAETAKKTPGLDTTKFSTHPKHKLYRA